ADVLTGDGDSNTLDGGYGDDTFYGEGGGDTLIGGPGTDTATYVSSNAGVQVSLTTHAGSGGHAQGDLLIGIENLTGSLFADVLTGDDGANTLDGSYGDDAFYGEGGADTLIGGAGTDTASYVSSNAGVQVSLATHAGQGGHAQGDLLIGIENLTGSLFADILTGDDGANILDGGNGDDAFYGEGGADTLIGG